MFDKWRCLNGSKMTRSQARFKYGEVNSMHPSKSRLTLGQRVKDLVGEDRLGHDANNET